MLQSLINIHNKIADKNAVWFPFQFLKPKSSGELISMGKVLVLSFFFGPYMFVFQQLRRWIFGVFSWEMISFLDLVYWTIGMFFWFTLVLRNCWNYRAKRLLVL